MLPQTLHPWINFDQLGLEKWLKDQGHEFIVSGFIEICVIFTKHPSAKVTSDKEGPDSAFQKHLPTTDVLITTPFHPGYLTAELVEKVDFILSYSGLHI